MLKHITKNYFKCIIRHFYYLKTNVALKPKKRDFMQIMYIEKIGKIFTLFVVFDNTYE